MFPGGLHSALLSGHQPALSAAADRENRCQSRSAACGRRSKGTRCLPLSPPRDCPAWRFSRSPEPPRYPSPRAAHPTVRSPRRRTRQQLCSYFLNAVGVGKGKDWVNGLIDSVSGNTIQVSQRSGTATVDFTPSTAVSEITPAQLTDITAGSCVSVRPDRHGASTEGGAITARSVRVSTAVDGKCPAPAHRHTKHSHQPPHGQVASVTGNTITLNSADSQSNSSQTSVTVTDTTKYTKQTATDARRSFKANASRHTGPRTAVARCRRGTSPCSRPTTATALNRAASTTATMRPGLHRTTRRERRYFLPRHALSNGSRHERGAISG